MRLLTFFLLATAAATAQKVDPVQWTLTLEPAKAGAGSTIAARFTAKIEPGYHLYSATTQGANPTQISLEENPAVASVTVYQQAPNRKMDPNFQLETETYDNEATFVLMVRLKPDAAPGPVTLTAKARYQACTETTCLLPKRKSASAELAVEGSAATEAGRPAGFVPVEKGTAPAKEASNPAPEEGLGAYLAIAVGFGLASIFTPCVFPMIPVLLSIFVNQTQESKGSLWGMAVVFCLGLIVFFTGIGLGVTAIAGPFGVIQLTANPWVNGGITLIFLALGLSMMGAFEIALPSGMLTKLNNLSSGGGYVGALLMGLTFALTAFACVGPFMGTLLAAGIQGGAARPAMGMAAYSAGLAAPFLLLGAFPALLNRMPRSGVWLARVKMVMGFVILAAALKYASNVDQVLQAGWLTRERFLAGWFVLFLLPGLYLLGVLHLEGVKPNEQVGWGRLLVATLFLAFAVSLLPGMFGAKLGELEGFLPFPNENSVQSSRGGGRSGQVWLKNDFEGALAQAKSENKPIFVSFTGYACTNCHWMKANMLPRTSVAQELDKFVRVELYTDGSDAASEANQKMQEERFQSVAIPFYALLTANGEVIATSQGLTRDEGTYVAFLRKGSL
jgi:thiol:disulfide interchange protein DsbD